MAISLDPAESGYRFAIEGTAIHHQEDGFVVDAAVVVDTAIVIFAFVVIRAGHLIRVAKGRWVTHAAEGTKT